MHQTRLSHSPRCWRRDRGASCGRWCSSLRTRGSTLPSFVRHSHCEVCTSLIFDLSSFIDERLRTGKILTVRALAFTPTENSSLKTLQEKRVGSAQSIPIPLETRVFHEMTYLAILLETLGTFAFATHIMRFHIVLNSRLEGVWILCFCFLNRFFTNGACRRSVSTIYTVTAVAETFGCKTLTIELQALGFFTVAHKFLGLGLLALVLLSFRWRSRHCWAWPHMRPCV